MNKQIRKYLSIVPFLTFVGLIFLPVLLILLSKDLFLLFYYILLLYISYKSIIFFTFSFVGLAKFQKNKNIDFLSKIEEISDSKLPIHLIAIAIYKEELGIILATLKSIESQNYPKNKIIINLSFEKRKLDEDPTYLEVVTKIIEFSKKSKLTIEITLHPSNLPNEVPGAASNKNWSVKSYLKNLTPKEVENCIVTIPDADTIFDKNYFANLSYKFLKSRTPEKIFVQPAVYKFQNNYDQLRSIGRIITTTLSLSILSTSAYKSKHRYTFSCFSLKLSTLIKSNFWDTSIPIDDTPFYWRPYDLFDGDWKCQEIYSPISVNAIHNSNILKNIQEQYVQFYRWGWGAIAFPIGIESIFSNKNISFFKKVRDTFTLFDNTIFTKTFFISFTICTLIDTYITDNLVKSFFEINLLIILIPITLLLRVIITPYQNFFTFIYKVAEDMIFVLPIGIINLVVFGYLPYLHASYDFARNQKHYEKITWSEKKE